jgi:hypothetical protein
LKEHIGTHRNIVFTGIAIIALASYVIPFSSIVPVSGQGVHVDTGLVFDILGGDAVNIARNLASFSDSSFNTLDQSNASGEPTAANIGRNLVLAVNDADFNTVEQDNDQSITDLGDPSEAANIGINDSDFSDSNNNDVDQSNSQEVFLKDKSFFSSSTGSEAANSGVNNAELEDSDNTEVSQNNEQNIEDVSEGSQATKIGVNTYQIISAGRNVVDQSNDQDIDDVKKGSSAGLTIEPNLNFFLFF